jgi:hypothetical protein
MASVLMFKPGMCVRHGAAGIVSREVIKHIVDYGHCKEFVFESGQVTYVPNTLHFDCDGVAQFFKYWQPGGCESKAYETISIIE